MVKYLFAYDKKTFSSFEHNLIPYLKFKNKIRYILARVFNATCDLLRFYILDPQHVKTDLLKNPRYKVLKHLWIPFGEDAPTSRLTWLLYYSEEIDDYIVKYGRLSATRTNVFKKNGFSYSNTHWLDYP